MTKTLLSFIMFFCLSSALADTIRLSEPVFQNPNSETFGTKLDMSLPKTSLASLLTEPDGHLGSRFIVETRISKVCQRKGCFFIAQQDQHMVRVSFKDYGFFIPTDSNGKTVMLSGELIEKELSVEQAAHFSSDLDSNSQAIKPGVVYEIVADSVTIPRT
ncbi:DUF4920 domain-containing protein [Aliiglaciecola sp. M165]|uniref:DUF4920 domain-containing protein n=1 Tax=Aliiglaciecola sp. M165 TaxID=2593649 RepID=UPI0011816CFE|nr:DUF4920 domain-containing protein [Aliiglaciecola sp. M165]TRY30606.1 DUF4920 domain-containing protein [Aliiglaciecola sp. M165]